MKTAGYLDELTWVFLLMISQPEAGFLLALWQDPRVTPGRHALKLERKGLPGSLPLMVL